MADCKKYNGSTWLHSLRKLGTSTDTITTPADIYANDTTATVGLKGNMSQSSTPTPSSPIQPSECGERTGNFLAANSTSAIVNTVTISNDNGKITVTGRASSEISSTNSAWKNAFTFRLKAGTYYFAGSASGGVSSYLRNANDDTRISMPNDSFVLSNDTDVYIGFYVYNNNDKTFNIMLNSGSTPLPYEPYGYKIPISSASTTTPVYLGEVETTRRIKKLVLTGEENWFLSTAQTGRFGLSLSNYLKTNETITSFCSHYTAIAQKSGGTAPNNSQYFYSGSDSARYMFIVDADCSTVADFKAYLAAQYANGTPVTVWYILANSTTGIVNEPIRKIGDYADTVSGITIPTITGADSFDVLTTLKPSEVSLSYTGWHDASAGEWDGSEWQ